MAESVEWASAVARLCGEFAMEASKHGSPQRASTKLTLLTSPLAFPLLARALQKFNG